MYIHVCSAYSLGKREMCIYRQYHIHTYWQPYKGNVFLNPVALQSVRKIMCSCVLCIVSWYTCWPYSSGKRDVCTGYTIYTCTYKGVIPSNGQAVCALCCPSCSTRTCSSSPLSFLEAVRGSFIPSPRYQRRCMHTCNSTTSCSPHTFCSSPLSLLEAVSGCSFPSPS